MGPWLRPAVKASKAFPTRDAEAPGTDAREEFREAADEAAERKGPVPQFLNRLPLPWRTR